MEESSGWKLFQKRIYDILSHRHGTVILICGCFLVIASAFQFGEAFLEWSEEKYATVFNSFSDNIAGRSYRKRLCLPVPIDVVYTWVNGSDPQLIYELRKHKRLMELQLNQTAKNYSGNCPFLNCIPTISMVIEPELPKYLSKETLGIIYPALKNATNIYAMKDPQDENGTVSVVEFEKEETLKEALKLRMEISGKNASYTLKQAYYTSDWTIPSTVLLPDMFLLSGFPHTFSEEDLKNHLPKTVLSFVNSVDIHSSKGIAVITMTNKEECIKFIEQGNVTIEGKQQQLNAAYLVWDLRDYTLEDDIAPSRFEDNEELRYSMRSIEQYAPWVRQIFLITNGQIPYWLNLDNPRLTLVTHQEIFANQSHLPSFSSPSIESHIHKIPGLSDKFIYMNDDVMFGKEVWPDDFYTHSKGQKIYLTWPVPNCQDGCPSTWIKDGYCDKACNNSECEWDGGDCIGAGAQNQGVGWGGAGGWNMGDNSALYCNSGCATNWIADKYCDQSCNVKQCGFDAGDCGTDNFHNLYQVVAHRNQTHYEAQRGQYIMYINISSLFGPECIITEGEYDDNNVIRSLAIAQKFKVVTLVLHADKNATTLNITLRGKENKDAEKILQFNFTLSVDTKTLKRDLIVYDNKSVAGLVYNDTKHHNQSAVRAKKDGEEKFEFPDIPLELQNPKAKRSTSSPVQPKVIQVNMTQYMLPEDIEKQLTLLVKEYKQGLLTEKGFKIRESLLWDKFLNILTLEGKKLVKKPTVSNFSKNITLHPNMTKTLKQNQSLEQNVKQNHDNLPNLNSQGGNKLKFEGDVNGKEYIVNGKLENAGLNVNNDENLVKSKHNIAPMQQQQDKVVGDPSMIKHDIPQNVDNNQQIDNNQRFAQKDSSRDIRKQKIGLYDNLVKDAKKIDAAGNNNVGREYNINKTHKSRTLNGFDNGEGLLPWEKTGLFAGIQKQLDEADRRESYETNYIRRRLLDHYSDSLRFVNKLYNADYGYQSRMVPAHMPHMIDKHIMYEMQAKYSDQWAATSSHRVRHSQDMQFSFSYFYYVMSEPNKFDTGDVFDVMDTDNSGVLSDREIRTFATRMYDLPLDLATLTGLETTFKDCASEQPQDPLLPQLQQEVYYDNTMPQVTRQVFKNCAKIQEVVKKKFNAGTKYKFELGDNEVVTFKMIRSNVSGVVGQLDDVRKKPTKFICLNDNIHHNTEEAKTVKAVLQDFYESIFPIPSSLELPREYRNRFLHIDELKEWKKYRDWLKLWTQLALFLLIMFTLASFFSDKIEALQRKLFGRRTANLPSNGRQQPNRPLQTV